MKLFWGLSPRGLYGRTEAADESDAAIRQTAQQGLQSGLNAFANEKKNKGEVVVGSGSGRKEDDSALQLQLETTTSPLLAAFAKDTTAAGKAVAELLQDPTPEAAAALLDRLPSLLPDDPEMATVIAEAMAEEFGVMLANSGTSEGARKGWETRRKNGWTPEQYESNVSTINSLVDDLNTTGPNGKGKGWKNTPKDLGEVNDDVAADIRKANPKMKATSGTMQTIDQKQLQHAIDEHGVGNETWPNSIPITHEDLKKIPDVLSSYDDIIAGKGKNEGKQQEAVIYRKKFDDGTVCCVEIDWFCRGANRHELKFQTMWKLKPGEE